MRALVVEDERTPRELLRDHVPWARFGFEIETAPNGLEALEVLRRGGVELVITDVRMPKMDGVELALEIRRQWPDCVLIFLSGFSDKEYLKTAIRVQAQDYLDKPIDLGVVEAAVAEASKTLQQRRALKDLSPLRRQAQAQALFESGEAELEQRFQLGPLRVLVLSSDSASGAVALINGGDFPCFAACPGPGSLVFVAADSALGADAPRFDEEVQRLLDLCGEGARVGLSTAVSGPLALPDALKEARAALSEAFYRPTVRVHTVKPPSGRALELTPETLELWRKLMEASDYPAVLRQLEQLEQRTFTARESDHDRVRAVWLQALEYLLAFVPAWGRAELSARTQRLALEFQAAPHLAALAAAARGCFERLFVLSPGDLHVGDRIQKATAYIETRFSDPDLTVDAVAGHVGFSESYFCTVFKQAQGITVKDFVTRHRIDRAKAYLWEKSPPTLADLALKVGFRDPNYFSTVFKRLTGTSPGAYRKKALG